MTSTDHKSIVEQAIKDPSHVYQTPQEVVEDERTTREYKLKILDNWALDERRLLDSQEENMGDNVESGAKQAELLQEISKLKKTV